MASEPRSRNARNRARDALARFALLAGDHVEDFVVIGGLNPDFLAPNAPTPHMGTTDVDLLFELGFVYDRDEQDFGWLDELIAEAKFSEGEGAGWQWQAVLEGSWVRIDLLCDVDDSPGQTIALPGATRVAAQNLKGPIAALDQPVRRSIAVPESMRETDAAAPEFVTMRFATPGGYIVAKASALSSRSLSKDAYDLVFVLLFSPGGPRTAAKAARQLTLPKHRRQHHEPPELQSCNLTVVSGSSEWSIRCSMPVTIPRQSNSAKMFSLASGRSCRRLISRVSSATEARTARRCRLPSLAHRLDAASAPRGACRRSQHD